MPPYMGFSFKFGRSVKKKGLVRSFYEVCLRNGAEYAGCYPIELDATLDEVIDFNQRKLDGGFQLGLRTHFRNNYRQIMFNLGDFCHCRLFIMFYDKEVSFNVVIPTHEFQAQPDDPTAPSSMNSAPDLYEKWRCLLTISKALWAELPVRRLVTDNEDGGDVIKDTQGRLITVGGPFAIVDDDCEIGPVPKTYAVSKLDCGWLLERTFGPGVGR